MDIQRDKHPQYRESDQSTGQHRADPMNRGVRSPPEPEHGDDQSPARDDTELQPFFWLWLLRSEFMRVLQVSGFDDCDEAAI